MDVAGWVCVITFLGLIWAFFKENQTAQWAFGAAFFATAVIDKLQG